jgi:hypothetical protein
MSERFTELTAQVRSLAESPHAISGIKRVATSLGRVSESF